MKPSTYQIWAPNIFEFKGGIQVYSAFLIRALREIEVGSPCSVYLKQDRRAPAGAENGAHLAYHCFGRVPRPLRTLAFGAALAVGVLKDRPDLTIMTHLNFSPVARWTDRLVGRPYWVVAHGIEAWNLTQPRLIAGLRGAERILAVSNYTRDRLLLELGLPAEQIAVLPNTFDQTRFAPGGRSEDLLARYRLPEQKRIILTVARLDSAERYKGYDQVLRAMPQILRAAPDAHYLLVGKGSDRPRVEALIRELKLEPHVTLAGFVADGELADHYNLCDVFAMPSKGEGFGIVYLEALGCGRPVLGGDRDGAIDALAGGKFGVLVDPDRTDQIAHSLVGILNRTLEHPLIYDPIGLRGAVIERFGFDRFRRTLKQLLDSRPADIAGRRSE